MSVEARLVELGITLPEPPPRGGTYVRARRSGNLLFTAGHGPSKDGSYLYLGKLGADVTVEEGYESARYCAINCLASAKEFLGTLDKVTGVIKVLGFVASAPNFNDQPKVMNGASDFLVELFGDSGAHARSAIGTNELPGNIPVEVEMILEIAENG
jgi:enamine deaminase RidA (YjgF/YER057c/UK114 family)